MRQVAISYIQGRLVSVYSSSNASLFTHIPSQAHNEVHLWGTLLHLQFPVQDFLHPQLFRAATPLLTSGRLVQWGIQTCSLSFHTHPKSPVGRQSGCLQSDMIFEQPLNPLLTGSYGQLVLSRNMYLHKSKMVLVLECVI